MKKICEYIVERFNKEYKDNPYGLVLQIREKKIGRYLLYFNRRDFYYDVEMSNQMVAKGKNFQMILGTVYFFSLGEKTSEEEYYLKFIQIVERLIKRSKKDYGIDFKALGNQLNNALIASKQRFLQESLPV